MAASLAAPARRSSRWIVPAILAATLLPFLWKAVGYVLLGSMLPLGTFVVLASIVGVGLFDGGSWRRGALQAWGAAAILWGTARLALQVLIVAADLSEAHLQSQVNVMSSLLSLGYIVARVALWRQA